MLEELKERRANVQEAINNILEAGQEFQTRTGRVKQANLQTLQNQLAMLNNEIAMMEGTSYSDTECYVYKGCR